MTTRRENATAFERAFSEHKRGIRRWQRRKTIICLVLYPPAFVVVNGSFILLAWLIGLWQVLEAGLLGFVYYLRLGLLHALYGANALAWGFVIVRLQRYLEKRWDEAALPKTLERGTDEPN